MFLFKKLLIIVGLLLLLLLTSFFAKRFYDSKHRIAIATEEVKELADNSEIKDGDIIFQTSLSKQSRAIQLATHSEYSHCGLIYKNGNNYFVFEAIQLVKLTPLNMWIARGQGGHFVIKRLKNADQVLTTETLKKMKEAGESFSGKNYDLYFNWSDDKIYCSELIWKVYQRATGLEVGKLEKLRNFDLTNEVVKQKMKERYGDNVPLDDTVISPESIFNSSLLTIVKSN